MTYAAPMRACALFSRLHPRPATCLSAVRRHVSSSPMGFVPATCQSKVQFVELQGQGLAERKAAIHDLRVVPLEGPSRYIRPRSIRYKQHGKDRRWDMVQSHPSVAVLLFHTELQLLLMVRQFRPTVLAAAAAAAAAEADIEGGEEGVNLTGDLEAAFTYELCAGLVDKAGKDLRQIAKEEVLEETGYDVPLESLQLVTAALTSVGISGARQTMFYAEVNEAQRTHAGGGKEEEGEGFVPASLPHPCQLPCPPSSPFSNFPPSPSPTTLPPDPFPTCPTQPPQAIDVVGQPVAQFLPLPTPASPLLLPFRTFPTSSLPPP
ncbi:unnamed protein product [Closterium sp. Naga37s-1]|nr:unnamed protein product [Closterium sp. Naga37s-1]